MAQLLCTTGLLQRGRTASHRADGGAVYVEFLIAFFPLLLLFAGLVQLEILFITRLFIAKAAFAGARTAAVYIPQPDAQGSVTHQVSDASRQAVEDAVNLSVAPVLLRGWLLSTPNVSFPAEPDGATSTERLDYADSDGDLVRVRVVARYRCHFPPVDWFMCSSGGDGAAITLAQEAVFPYQKADYQYDDDVGSSQPELPARDGRAWSK